MGTCNCPKRFPISSCCQRYLEDGMGFLVHTETVCYEKDERGMVKHVFSTELKQPVHVDLIVKTEKAADFIPLSFIITSGSNE